MPEEEWSDTASDKQMTDAETEEKDSQANYDSMLNKSAEKRTLDSKSLTQKESTKASVDGDLETHKDDKSQNSKELAATLEYIASLHSKCNWLVKYFEVREEAK